jgi:hypothetical protein
VNLAPLSGKRLAILVAGKDASGEDDWRAAVGTARVEGARLFVDWDEGGEPLEIEPESAGSIRRTTKDLRAMLGNAEYFLRVDAGAAPG